MKKSLFILPIVAIFSISLASCSGTSDPTDDHTLQNDTNVHKLIFTSSSVIFEMETYEGDTYESLYPYFPIPPLKYGYDVRWDIDINKVDDKGNPVVYDKDIKEIFVTTIYTKI
jgi:hypothetical protein